MVIRPRASRRGRANRGTAHDRRESCTEAAQWSWGCITRQAGRIFYGGRTTENASYDTSRSRLQPDPCHTQGTSPDLVEMFGKPAGEPRL